LSYSLDRGKHWITFACLNVGHLGAIKPDSATNVALRHFAESYDSTKGDFEPDIRTRAGRSSRKFYPLSGMVEKGLQ